MTNKEKSLLKKYSCMIFGYDHENEPINFTQFHLTAKEHIKDQDVLLYQCNSNQVLLACKNHYILYIDHESCILIAKTSNLGYIQSTKYIPYIEPSNKGYSFNIPIKNNDDQHLIAYYPLEVLEIKTLDQCNQYINIKEITLDLIRQI